MQGEPSLRSNSKHDDDPQILHSFSFKFPKDQRLPPLLPLGVACE